MLFAKLFPYFVIIIGLALLGNQLYKKGVQGLLYWPDAFLGAVFIFAGILIAFLEKNPPP